ncbi:MAG: hypothetical protein U9P71_06285 [Campylobacterota bacterium]|nr:hypothetical protein [Campylobacterota bacterium]
MNKIQPSIINRINVQVKKSYYTFERYNSVSTFALLYHEEPMTVVELSSFVRISDHFIQIDDNHYFITFAFTTQDNTYKAVQNLVHHLDNHFNNRKTCIAIDNFDVTNAPHLVFNRLQQILEETKRNSFTRVEDESILDTNF